MSKEIPWDSAELVVTTEDGETVSIGNLESVDIEVEATDMEFDT